MAQGELIDQGSLFHQAFLHCKLCNIAVPDRNIGKIQFESLNSMVIPLDCEQFAVPGHAVSEGGAAAAGKAR